MRPGFLKAESLNLLFTTQKTITGEPTHYSLGWKCIRGMRLHAGDSVGGNAVLLTHPASRTVVALATNGGQLLLRNSIALGKAPVEAVELVLNKDLVAAKIARAFMQPAA